MLIKKVMKLKNVGIVDFADTAKVSRVTMRQVIDGLRWKHITVDFAVGVARASDGIIAVEDFHSDTAKPVAEAEADGPARVGTGTDG